MTPGPTVTRVMSSGFTPRQAAFLVTVMRHGGVCLVRQYCAFARIAYGAAPRAFFADLVTRRFATAYPLSRRGGSVYHVHAKSLYEAIGEPNNRHRKAMSLARAVEHLILLDTVIAEQDVAWLATEQEKVDHFTRVTRLRRDELPRLVFRGPGSETVRHFPDKLPIGVRNHDRSHDFLYVVNRDVPVDFRAYLYRHANLISALPDWRIRLLVPEPWRASSPSFVQACEEEYGVRLAAATVDELRWYFHQRRAIRAEPPAGANAARYQRARRAFGSVRYHVLYRHWLTVGDSLLRALDSPALPDALAAGNGRIESEVITRRYDRLSPLVGTA